MKRVQIKKPLKSGGAYFATSGSVKFIPSGNCLLDLALGGGWACGRVSNIIGDKSTGKTLIAMEMMANAMKTYPG